MVRRLSLPDYKAMPWKNGGGSTTELVVEPRDASLASSGRFLYRVSIADVASDGPFSPFPGYDRHIMLVDGAGVTLDAGPHGTIELSALFEPRGFSGDWDVHARLREGPVRDFNLIVDRERATSSLEVRELRDGERAATVAAGGATSCVVHVLSGSLEGAATGDTLVIDAPLELAARGDARVAIARVRMRSSRGH